MKQKRTSRLLFELYVASFYRQATFLFFGQPEAAMKWIPFCNKENTDWNLKNCEEFREKLIDFLGRKLSKL